MSRAHIAIMLGSLEPLHGVCYERGFVPISINIVVHMRTLDQSKLVLSHRVSNTSSA